MLSRLFAGSRNRHINMASNPILESFRRDRRSVEGPWRYENCDFDQSDLLGRCWIGVEFHNCVLRFADFTESDLSYARFINCDLYNANFTRAVLYAAWFSDCDMTKAVFADSLLSGVRIKGCNVTHTEFDETPALGRVRKSVKTGLGNSVPSTFLRVDLGGVVGPVEEVEKRWAGIYCEGFDRAVEFSDDSPSERWRRWRRREEISKILKLVQLENGYYERALSYYYFERKFRRKAMPWLSKKGPRHLADLFAGELLWAYGTSMVRPFVVYALATFGASALLLALPRIIARSGLVLGSCVSGSCRLISFSSMNPTRIIDVAYFLATAAFGNSTYGPVGFGRLIFLMYEVLSLVLLSLWFASVARRLANI
jgi:hypothetical protein